MNYLYKKSLLSLKSDNFLRSFIKEKKQNIEHFAVHQRSRGQRPLATSSGRPNMTRESQLAMAGMRGLRGESLTPGSDALFLGRPFLSRVQNVGNGSTLLSLFSDAFVLRNGLKIHELATLYTTYIRHFLHDLHVRLNIAALSIC